jgi:hypothetical protein
MGVSGNSAPLTPQNGWAVRYQQVYQAAEFSTLSGPQCIRSIAFRPYKDSGAFTLNIPHLRVWLSTTQAGPDELSNLLAANLGPNNVLVYDGPFTVSTAATDLPDGTHAFDVVIPLQRPFFYDPTKGNLLMEIRHSGTDAASAKFLDIDWSATDSMSRCYAENSETASLASVIDSVGLITQFQFAMGDILDQDLDHMADSWERDYFGSTSLSSGSTDDQDADAFPDLCEYGAGTDPTNSLSLLYLRSGPRMEGSGVILEWSSVSGKVYRVEQCPALNQPWSTCGSGIQGDPPFNQYPVSGTPDMAYFRIVVTP